MDKNKRVLDERVGIGISWLWMLPNTHPFQKAAEWHDVQYTNREKGGLRELKTSREVDQMFYRLCLGAAGSSIKLKAQAWLFYRIVRVWGFFNWPK